MNILDMLKENKNQKAFELSYQEAKKMFEAQRQGIQAIKDTKGYKDIKEFFKYQKELAIKRLIDSKSDQPVARAMVELATNHLTFLENLER